MYDVVVLGAEQTNADVETVAGRDKKMSGWTRG